MHHDCSQAQFIVAIHYAMGLGVDINKDKAKNYLEQSAKQGFVHSETALGILYLEDDEYDRALMWLERAEQKVIVASLLHNRHINQLLI